MSKPSSWKSLVVGNAATKICGPSDARTAVTISTASQTLYVAPQADVASGTGVQILATTQPVQLCQCHVGDFVKRELYAIAPGGNTNVFVVEGFEPWPAK